MTTSRRTESAEVGVFTHAASERRRARIAGVHVLGIALVALGAVGCGPTAMSRFYTLDATATAGTAPPLKTTVLVGPVSVPSSVDRPQFVVQVAPNRVEIEEFNRWAAPLNESIARAVAGDLMILLGTQDVVTGSLVNFAPAYRVTIDVQSFETIPSKSVLVDALWAVRKTGGGDARPGRTIARETVEGAGYDALAAAHSRALAKVSADIAAAIRESAGSKR